MVRRALTVLLLTACASPAGIAAAPDARVAAVRQPGSRASVLPPPAFSEFFDPDPYVSTKEFALAYTPPPDSGGRGIPHGLFHLIYQRSGGPQSGEIMFGHAWSVDLASWSVDTLAFAVDSTWWNAAHVWSPSIVLHDSKYYMFYTGVDANNDQRIGYTSTTALDTTGIV